MLCCKKEKKEHIFIITTSQRKKKSSILNTQLYNTNVVFTGQKESHIRFMSLKIHLFTGNSIMYINMHRQLYHKIKIKHDISIECWIEEEQNQFQLI